MALYALRSSSGLGRRSFDRTRECSQVNRVHGFKSRPEHLSQSCQPQPDPSQMPAFDRAMRALVKVPKSELDAARRKEMKATASKRKRK
jgi:hypothetical protein